MGWNLPPGCTDKDIDDAAPREAETIEEYQDMRREAIWVERTMHDIETAFDELCGQGYEKEAKEVFDKVQREHWPIVHHYRGEAAE